VSCILPQPGERFLDVATGTGWTARLLASRGAAVTGVDIRSGAIEAAKALAADIDFRVGDAEALPFGENSFDAVTSTFGVMFVAWPEVATRELSPGLQERGSPGPCDMGARRDGCRHISDNAALHASAATRPAAFSVRMGAPGAGSRIARRRL
jgi:ubiquinone/menaquinone biosynthesis C-methylase UbiE